jgi:hypothetical protein
MSYSKISSQKIRTKSRYRGNGGRSRSQAAVHTKLWPVLPFGLSAHPGGHHEIAIPSPNARAALRGAFGGRKIAHF